MAKLNKRTRAIREKVEVGKLYVAEEAFALLKELSSVKFSESIDVTDAIVILSHLALGVRYDDCHDALDSDDSGTIEISDPIYLLNYLFLAGAAPPSPFNECGPDPTDDTLDCDEYLCIR